MRGALTFGLIFTALLISSAHASPRPLDNKNNKTPPRINATTPRPPPSTTKPQAVLSPYKGKVALLTGASHGIGAQIAETLVKAGLTVVGIGRHTEPIQAAADQLKNYTGRLIPRKVDITNETEIINTVKWIDSELGGLTILINDAGAFFIKPIYEYTMQEMRTIFDVNVLAATITIREAAKSFTRRNVTDGYIFNINSIAGHTVPYYPHANFGLYPASKHAITAIGESLRQAFHDDKLRVRVTSISPGATRTTGHSTSSDDQFEQFLTPDDIARAVEFCLSLPLSAEVTELTIRPTGEVQ